MMSTDPELLLVLAKEGDGDSLGRLLERYRNYLILMARMQVGRTLQGKFDAEDVLQDTALAAHRSIGRFRGRSEQEFQAWLLRILASVLANLVRRFRGTKRRDPRLERGLAEDLDRSSRALERGLVAAHSSPSQQASRREQAFLLADALGKLPDDYREVIILRQLEDLSFADVALRMQRSEDSVKNLWVRALARMRLAMEDPR
jgi:RNA polymerase sigma-70 factor, ECF subfamily